MRLNGVESVAKYFGVLKTPKCYKINHFRNMQVHLWFVLFVYHSENLAEKKNPQVSSVAFCVLLICEVSITNKNIAVLILGTG